MSSGLHAEYLEEMREKYQDRFVSENTNPAQADKD